MQKASRTANYMMLKREVTRQKAWLKKLLHNERGRHTTRCQGRFSAIPGKAFFWVPGIRAINATSRRLSAHTVKQPCPRALFPWPPTVQKCRAVPRLSSGAERLLPKQNPAAVSAACSTDTPKTQRGQGWTSFGFLRCIRTRKATPAGSDLSNITSSPFVSCY